MNKKKSFLKFDDVPNTNSAFEHHNDIEELYSY